MYSHVQGASGRAGMSGGSLKNQQVSPVRRCTRIHEDVLLTVIAQVQRLLAETETVQSEFDAIKDHLESYMTATAPAPTPKAGKSKQPSRHIQQLTAKAAKVLNRDVPGMNMLGARTKRKDGTGDGKGKERAAWDELAAFESKHSWKGAAGDLDQDERGERAALEKLWAKTSIS